MLLRSKSKTNHQINVVLGLWNPHAHFSHCFRAKTVVIVITIVALITQSYIFKTAGIIEANGYEECEMLPIYHSFMKVVNCIDTVATLIVPLVLIVVMNTMIARNLFLFRKRLQSGSLDECLYDDTEHTELQRTQTAVSSLQISFHDILLLGRI